MHTISGRRSSRRTGITCVGALRARRVEVSEGRHETRAAPGPSTAAAARKTYLAACEWLEESTRGCGTRPSSLDVRVLVSAPCPGLTRVEGATHKPPNRLTLDISVLTAPKTGQRNGEREKRSEEDGKVRANQSHGRSLLARISGASVRLTTTLLSPDAYHAWYGDPRRTAGMSRKRSRLSRVSFRSTFSSRSHARDLAGDSKCGHGQGSMQAQRSAEKDERVKE